MKRLTPFAVALTLVSFCTRADELKLKDGTKVVGTVVGFEDNSFKVKTTYGYALVQKDQVVSISMADAAKKPDAAKQPGPKAPDAKPSDTAPKAQPPPEAPASPAPKVGNAKPAARTGSDAPRAGTPAIAAVNSPSTAASSAPTALVPSAARPVVPEPIREEVLGNSYVNETYGFRMYKPPDWQLIAGARTLLPGAITAMGTGDQTTYLLIGQDRAGKSLVADMNATEQRLRDVMDNFRPLGEKRITISGSDAVERRFRGSVDEHDWSGTVVLISHGSQVYTIFGMTYADTDLVQIQENVIARSISSLQFNNP